MLRVWLQAPGGGILWLHPSETFFGCYSSSAFGLSCSPWSSKMTPESFALSLAVALSYIQFWLLPLGLYVNSLYTWDRVQKCRVEPEWKLFLMSPPVSASLLLWLFWPQGRQSWDKCPPVLLLLPFFNGYTSYPTSFLSFFVPQNLTLGLSLVINLQFNF